MSRHQAVTISRHIPHGKIRRMTVGERWNIREMFRAGKHINDIHRETGWSFGTLKKYQERSMKAHEFKKIRTELGLSVRELQQELGLRSERIIVAIEQGEAEPTRVMELAMWKLAEGIAR